METLRFQLLPPEPDDTFWGAPCEQPLERRYQALPALVCIMCCLFGVVYCFFGEIPLVPHLWPSTVSLRFLFLCFFDYQFSGLRFDLVIMSFPSPRIYLEQLTLHSFLLS